MAPHTIGSRSTVLVLSMLVLAIAVALPVSQAAAQSGTGLYEPFPEAAVKKRAQRYVERLSGRTGDAGGRYSDGQLAKGVFVRPGSPAPALRPSSHGDPPGAASARAGARGDPDVALPLQLLLLAFALALPATALAVRARTRAA